jgi:hypothetical protein
MPVLIHEVPTPVAQVYQYRAYTGASGPSPLASPTLNMPSREWLALFEHLKSWQAKASEDSDINREACRVAVLYAKHAALRGDQLPARVGLTNNGGVAFEWDDGDRMTCIEIHDGVHAEKSVFEGVKLVEDRDLEWSPGERDFRPVNW